MVFTRKQCKLEGNQLSLGEAMVEEQAVIEEVVEAKPVVEVEFSSEEEDFEEERVVVCKSIYCKYTNRNCGRSPCVHQKSRFTSSLPNGYESSQSEESYPSEKSEEYEDNSFETMESLHNAISRNMKVNVLSEELVVEYQSRVRRCISGLKITHGVEYEANSVECKVMSLLYTNGGGKVDLIDVMVCLEGIGWCLEVTDEGIQWVVPGYAYKSRYRHNQVGVDRFELSKLESHLKIYGFERRNDPIPPCYRFNLFDDNNVSSVSFYRNYREHCEVGFSCAVVSSALDIIDGMKCSEDCNLPLLDWDHVAQLKRDTLIVLFGVNGVGTLSEDYDLEDLVNDCESVVYRVESFGQNNEMDLVLVQHLSGPRGVEYSFVHMWPYVARGVRLPVNYIVYPLPSLWSRIDSAACFNTDLYLLHETSLAPISRYEGRRSVDDNSRVDLVESALRDGGYVEVELAFDLIRNMLRFREFHVPAGCLFRCERTVRLSVGQIIVLFKRGFEDELPAKYNFGHVVELKHCVLYRMKSYNSFDKSIDLQYLSNYDFHGAAASDVLWPSRVNVKVPVNGFFIYPIDSMWKEVDEKFNCTDSMYKDSPPGGNYTLLAPCNVRGRAEYLRREYRNLEKLRNILGEERSKKVKSGVFGLKSFNVVRNAVNLIDQFSDFNKAKADNGNGGYVLFDEFVCAGVEQFGIGTLIVLMARPQQKIEEEGLHWELCNDLDVMLSTMDCVVYRVIDVYDLFAFDNCSLLMKRTMLEAPIVDSVQYMDLELQGSVGLSNRSVDLSVVSSIWPDKISGIEAPATCFVCPNATLWGRIDTSLKINTEKYFEFGTPRAPALEGRLKRNASAVLFTRHGKY